MLASNFLIFVIFMCCSNCYY